jgi:hypothetical protein
VHCTNTALILRVALCHVHVTQLEGQMTNLVVVVHGLLQWCQPNMQYIFIFEIAKKRFRVPKINFINHHDGNCQLLYFSYHIILLCTVPVRPFPADVDLLGVSALAGVPKLSFACPSIWRIFFTGGGIYHKT